MNRRRFIKTGLLFVPTIFHAGAYGSVRMGHLSTEVGSWLGRVRSNAGSANGLAVVASDRWVKSVIVAGLRSTVKRVNLFVGDQKAAAIVPLIKEIGSDTEAHDDTINYSQANGVTLINPGGTGQLGTGVNPATAISTNDAHMAIYLGGATGEEEKFVMGVIGGGTDHMYMIIAYTGLGSGGTMYSNTNIVGADTNGTGFYMVTRTSGSADGVKAYRNATLLVTSSAVGGSPPSAVGTGFQVMNSVNSTTGTSRAGRGYQLGTAINATQEATFNRIWQEFETMLSRQV